MNGVSPPEPKPKASRSQAPCFSKEREQSLSLWLSPNLSLSLSLTRVFCEERKANWQPWICFLKYGGLEGTEIPTDGCDIFLCPDRDVSSWKFVSLQSHHTIAKASLASVRHHVGSQNALWAPGRHGTNGDVMHEVLFKYKAVDDPLKEWKLLLKRQYRKKKKKEK